MFELLILCFAIFVFALNAYKALSSLFFTLVYHVVVATFFFILSLFLSPKNYRKKMVTFVFSSLRFSFFSSFRLLKLFWSLSRSLSKSNFSTMPSIDVFVFWCVLGERFPKNFFEQDHQPKKSTRRPSQPAFLSPAAVSASSAKIKTVEPQVDKGSSQEAASSVRVLFCSLKAFWNVADPVLFPIVCEIVFGDLKSGE
jgi:glucan phosphoethanolaminetransferase (alkaline phosphatase superfamily)